MVPTGCAGTVRGALCAIVSYANDRMRGVAGLCGVVWVCLCLDAGVTLVCDPSAVTYECSHCVYGVPAQWANVIDPGVIKQRPHISA